MSPAVSKPPGSRAQGLQNCPDSGTIDVRTPSGDLVYRATDKQARTLLANNVCEPVRSRSGVVRYLRMHRNPPAKRFITTAAQGSFTVTREPVHGHDRTGIVYQHNNNGRGWQRS